MVRLKLQENYKLQYLKQFHSNYWKFFPLLRDLTLQLSYLVAMLNDNKLDD